MRLLSRHPAEGPERVCDPPPRADLVGAAALQRRHPAEGPVGVLGPRLALGVVAT